MLSKLTLFQRSSKHQRGQYFFFFLRIRVFIYVISNIRDIITSTSLVYSFWICLESISLAVMHCQEEGEQSAKNFTAIISNGPILVEGIVSVVSNSIFYIDFTSREFFWDGISVKKKTIVMFYFRAQTVNGQSSQWPRAFYRDKLSLPSFLLSAFSANYVNLNRANPFWH